jgi:hypothetical protein
MNALQTARRSPAGIWKLAAIAILAPAIVLASAAILVALLGIFVAWLIAVGVLVAAIVISDLARRSLRRMTPVGHFNRQAVGIPGR